MKNRLFSVREVCYIALFAAAIVVFAWIAIPAALPYTLQTFGIFLCTGLLGTKCATATVVVYIMLGAAGLPVFAGGNGGISAIFSPKGGYILGFVPATIICGKLQKGLSSSFFYSFLSMAAGLAVCYTFGVIWYMAYFNFDFPLRFILWQCVIPYLPFDIAKIVFAALISRKMRKFICLK